MNPNRPIALMAYKPRPHAKRMTQQAIFEAVQEVFEIDIKTAAKQNSPVKTGTNKRSIDTEVTQTSKGVQAELFTQSGYGGYLEIGTSKMKARPYLIPAFDKFRKSLL